MTTTPAFNPAYLQLMSTENGFAVAEVPRDRYLPFRPPKLSEHLIHLLWRNGLYDKSALKTTSGLPLKIVSAGRFNRAAGPDFKNAVIIAGGERLIGDVEIHKNAREWLEHKHDRSPLYNNTVLHVCLEHGQNTPPARTKKGKVPHELELGLYMRHPIEELHEELESAQAPVTSRPADAPCRTLLAKMDPADIARLLDLVGDGRMLIKSNRVIDRLEKGDAEQVLHELIAEYLGYARFTAQFRALARAIGKKEIGQIISRNPALPPHICAQTVYFRLSGLAQGGGGEMADYLTMLERVDCGDIQPLFTRNDWPLAACRPANYPERRIAALSHIAAYGPSAKQYHALWESLPLPPDEKAVKAFVKNILERFTGISDPFWDFHYSFTRHAKRAKKLVGRDKALSLALDCLVPFLLAQCRRDNDTAMEQRLVAVYHALPPSASNAVVDYMARNMIGKENPFQARSVRHQQALLQLYKDFCHRAPAGCEGCAFVEYLKIFK